MKDSDKTQHALFLVSTEPSPTIQNVSQAGTVVSSSAGKYQHSGSHCPVQQAGEPSRYLRAEGVAQEADRVARWGLVTP